MMATVLSGLLMALGQPGVDASLRIASTAFPDSPCAGRIVVLWDTDLGERRNGASGEAAGRQFIDGEWRTVNCTITLDPAAERRCDLIVHEAGHLSGIDEHVAGTIMSPNAKPGWPACNPRLRSWPRRSVHGVTHRSGSHHAEAVLTAAGVIEAKP